MRLLDTIFKRYNRANENTFLYVFNLADTECKVRNSTSSNKLKKTVLVEPGYVEFNLAQVSEDYFYLFI